MDKATLNLLHKATERSINRLKEIREADELDKLGYLYKALTYEIDNIGNKIKDLESNGN